MRVHRLQEGVFAVLYDCVFFGIRDTPACICYLGFVIDVNRGAIGRRLVVGPPFEQTKQLKFEFKFELVMLNTHMLLVVDRNCKSIVDIAAVD